MTAASHTHWAVRLGFANSVGFGLTTILPLWVTSVGSQLHASAVTIGAIAAAQLLFCGVANLAARWILRTADPLRFARGALLCAFAATLMQTWLPLEPFVVGAAIGGGATGVLLACTNRLAAGSEHVQRNYVIFQLMEVAFAGTLMLLGGFLLASYGVRAVFLCFAVVQLAAFCVLLGVAGDGQLVDSTSAEGRHQNRARGWATLVAIMLFFAGQSVVNSHLVPIGHAAALTARSVAAVMSFSVFCGLLGAGIARVVGNRWGIALPIAAAGLGMALDLVMLGGARTPIAYVIGSCLIPVGTYFMLPYFFTSLARLDRRGSFAAIAPAFILAGVATGPVIAAYLAEHVGAASLGWAGGALILVSAALFIPLFPRAPNGPPPHTLVPSLATS